MYTYVYIYVYLSAIYICIFICLLSQKADRYTAIYIHLYVYKCIHICICVYLRATVHTVLGCKPLTRYMYSYLYVDYYCAYKYTFVSIYSFFMSAMLCF